MTTQNVNFQLYPCGSATIALPEVLTSDAFNRLDLAVNDALCQPRRDISANAAGDPGPIESDACRLAQY
ncbi:MAG: hypothetical protein H3C29_11930 [Simplicispira suum]|uniref:hypothetical protein n=1 Tax=Simplicispira suum TaxID=2109915 RepID=UPI001C6C1B0D|nr:hypothetical protein [Simplicispira suum]MBW7833914.1 hypothetical protein [Simplicispira suum]MCO5102942.1 hypothetical protein [Burkholderiaceae bacterium]